MRLPTSPRLPITVWTLLKQVLLAALGLFMRIRVIGNIALPLRSGFIVAMNHLNGADSIVVQLALRTRLFFLVSAKWFAGRVSRFVMTQLCDGIAVETGNPLLSVAGLRRCIALLTAGGNIGVFPEGRFNRTENIDNIKDGTAYLAVRSGRPVLPVLVRNLRTGVQIDDSDRRRECWTGFLSLAENLTNTDVQLLVGEPIFPRPEAAGSREELRNEVKRIGAILKQQFRELAARRPAA